MASENIALDENSRFGLAGVTNDSNQFILNGRINPISNRLIVEGVVTSSNTSIGSTIPGGTEGSVLFIGAGSTLAQDNSNFFWDDSNFYLGLGTDTPNATLTVYGTVSFNLGSDATGDIFYRGSDGLLHNLAIGTAGQVLTVVSSLPAWATPGAGSSGYNLFQNNGTGVTQRTTVNLPLQDSLQILNVTDTGTVTNLTINLTNLGNDSTLISTLTSNTTFLTDFVTNLVADTGLFDTFVTDIADNSTFISTIATNLLDDPTFVSDLITIINTDPSLSIDLTSQVTGILPVSNGGTGDSAFTAYAPVFGGTTSTAPLQSGTVGTSGQVLTSNGAGVLPTFQAPTGGIINGATTSFLFDEFQGGQLSSTEYIVGELGWILSGNGGSFTASVTNDGIDHPGVISMVSTTSNRQGMNLGSAGVLGGTIQIPNLILEADIKLSGSGTSNLSEYFFGICVSQANSTSFTSASFVKVGWIMPAGTGNWSGYTSNGTTQNMVGSTNASFGSYVRLTMVFDATGANVEFFRDGVSEGSIAIPSSSGTNTRPWLQFGGDVGSQGMSIDYYSQFQSLTR